MMIERTFLLPFEYLALHTRCIVADCRKASNAVPGLGVVSDSCIRIYAFCMMKIERLMH